MKKSIIIIVLLASISLLFTACAPGQYANPEDLRPKVALFDAPNGLQVNGLKKVLYATLNANDATQAFNVLSTNRTDYYETNGSIIGEQAEYYGAIATRRLASDLGVFVNAPILERKVFTKTSEQDIDNDGFADLKSDYRLVVTKLQLETFILDPVTEQRVVTYRSNIYESVRREKASRQLVDKEQDPDVWKMANIALREFSHLVADDISQYLN